MDDFQLADCLIRPAEHLVQRADGPIRVEPRTMALLVFLAERAGRVVSRQQIEDELWAGRVVGYEALTQTVAKLRRALGDDRQQPRFLLTIPKEGYKLIVAPGPPPAPQPALPPARRRRLATRRAVVLALMVALAVLAAWHYGGSAVPVRAQAPKPPTVAVLPFANHTPDPSTGYLVEGLTEDLITALTQFPEFSVITLNSASAFQGQPLDLARVRREFGARYVVTGSVSGGDEGVRINAQLIDTEAGRHIWAEKYVHPRGDVLAIQDRIVDSISGRLLPHVQEAEKRRARHKPTENLDAYDLFQRARSEKHKLTAEGEARAVALLQEAIALDPNFAEAHLLLGWAKGLYRVFTGDGPPFDEALGHVHRGIELNPNLSLGYQALAQVLTFMGRHEEAAKAGLKGIELNPNDAENHIMFSRAASSAGSYKEAIASAERAVALNPLYPKWYPFILGRALYADDQLERAAEVCADGMARQAFLATGVTCLAVLARLGRSEQAAAMRESVRAMAPQLTIAHATASWGFGEAGMNRRFAADLRRGGLPD